MNMLIKIPREILLYYAYDIVDFLFLKITKNGYIDTKYDKMNER